MSASSKFFQSSSTKGAREYSNQFLTKCKHWLENHPVISNSLLTLNLWIAGDLLAQYSEHQMEKKKLLASSSSATTAASTTVTTAAADEEKQKKKKNTNSTTESTTTTTTTTTKYDFRRTAECASYGAFFTGPLLAVWYPYLDKICGPTGYNVTSKFGGSLWAAPIIKVLADEFLMDPPCLLVFFGHMNICEGGTLQTYQHKLQNEFMTSWLTSLAVWPIVLLGTFRYLPVYAQAPLINVCCIIWDGFLSHRNAVARIKEEEAEAAKAAAAAAEKNKNKKQNEDNKSNNKK